MDFSTPWSHPHTAGCDTTPSPSTLRFSEARYGIFVGSVAALVVAWTSGYVGTLVTWVLTAVSELEKFKGR